MYRTNSSQPSMIERIVAALTYLTMGFAGFIWLILGLFTKANLKHFMQYHIFQSIFISITLVLLSYILSFLTNILSFIPLINKLVAQITFLLNMPILFDYSLIQTGIYIVLIYLAITSFMGRYSYIPWVSEIIDQNISR